MATATEINPSEAVLRAALSACLNALEALPEDDAHDWRVRTSEAVAKTSQALARTVEGHRLRRQVEGLRMVAATLADRVDALEGSADLEAIRVQIEALQGQGRQVRAELADLSRALRVWTGLDAGAELEVSPIGHAELDAALSALEGNP